MFIYVGGIPCVGKTTIIGMVIELAQESNFPIQSLEEKELLYQITGVKSAQDYAKLPKVTRAEARRQMTEYFYEIDNKDLITIRIRDDHFTAPKEDGSYWVRQLEEKDRRHMLAFTVIVAKPKIILHRRLGCRFIPPEPDFFDVNIITLHQDMEIRVASSQADYLQIPLKVIQNEEREMQRTSILLFLFIQEIVKRVK